MTEARTNKQDGPQLSVVVPFLDEQENIQPLYQDIRKALLETGRSYEMIFVNDGSTDQTPQLLRSIRERDDAVRVVDLLRNYGQTAAMMAGFDHAHGDIIIAMDGDGQNDPADIPKLLDKLDEGYDVVSGWRADRQDNRVTRTIPSSFANWLISKVSGVHLHDYGCSFKAYRRELIQPVRLYGEMHRFIPIYTAWQGGRIAEVIVNHRRRLGGRSKYGLSRVFKVLLDLLLVSFMERYMTKPIYVFGGFGFVSLFLGFLCFLWAVWLKLFEDTSFIQTPLPVLVGTFFTTGVLCILMGLLAELIMRTYFEAQGKSVYQVRNAKGRKDR